MKRLPYLILLTFSNIIQGQNIEVYHKHDLEILKDSLWIKYKLWNYANSYNLINKDKIFFDSTIKYISFIDIPVFAFKSEAVNYDYGLNLFSFLEKDSTTVNGFIVRNDSIVGHIEGFLKDNSWHHGIIDVFQKHDPPYKEYEKLSNEFKNTIYTITPIDFLWYNSKNSTFVALPFGRFIPAETLIKNYVTLETIRKYYSKRDYGGITNKIKKGYVTVDSIMKSYNKNIYDSLIIDHK